MNWLYRLIDRLFVIFGALIFSQAPLFMQQYTHQLSGHTAELHYQVEVLKKSAELSRKDLPEYIKKFEVNTDPDFSHQGQMMQDLVDRWHAFDTAYYLMTHSNLYSKPIYFITYLSPDVALATWKNYEFGIPFTPEGLIYALIGMFVGYAIFASIARILNNLMLIIFRKKN